jgi:hypothetical protein
MPTDMNRPASNSLEERQFVAECVINHYCIGDLKFLYEDYDPEATEELESKLGLTTEEFIDKWGDYIEETSGELEELVRETLFGEE